MEKKIYSSRFWTRFLWFSIIINFIAIVIDTYFLITSILENNITNTIVFIMGDIFFVLLSFLVFFYVNRVGCKIWFDNSTNELCREGYICGFQHRVNVKNIKSVKISTLPKDGTYIIIVDDYCTSNEPFSKHSAIRFTYNKDNLEFLKEFWHGEIEGLEFHN